VSHLWQIYGKGPFSVAQVDSYETELYGGLKNIGCDIARRLPEGAPNSKELVLDFCRKGAYRVLAFQ
jgi:hypothetical protein